MNTTERKSRGLAERLFGVVFNLCPACFKGSIFKGIMKMNDKCPECGLVFERESGYFAGAMPLSYIIGFVVTLPTFLILLFRDVSLLYVVGIPGLEAALMAPFIFRFSRLLWIHFDRSVE